MSGTEAIICKELASSCITKCTYDLVHRVKAELHLHPLFSHPNLKLLQFSLNLSPSCLIACYHQLTDVCTQCHPIYMFSISQTTKIVKVLNQSKRK